MKPEETVDSVETIPARHIVMKTKTAEWFGNDYNMNIYKGCCHGCIYCDSRSQCYGIERFDQVRVKENALEIIRDDLRRKVKKGVVGTGAMSDPYNPLEHRLLLTRHALELIDAFEFGVSVATKGTLISRDIDILQSIKVHSPVLCKLTITTSDDTLSRKIEPGAPLSSKRFETLGQLRQAGLFAGLLLMPVLPFIEDTRENILSIVERAAECRANFIYPAFGVTLRQNQRDYFYRKLNEIFPGSHYTDAYRKRFGNTYSCHSPKQKELYEMFEEACVKHGILYKMKDIIHAYKKDYGDNQLSIFDFGL